MRDPGGIVGPTQPDVGNGEPAPGFAGLAGFGFNRTRCGHRVDVGEGNRNQVGPQCEYVGPEKPPGGGREHLHSLAGDQLIHGVR